jgi:pimeloyl-ACP methyl ester carboxylesterase
MRFAPALAILVAASAVPLSQAQEAAAARGTCVKLETVPDGLKSAAEIDAMVSGWGANQASLYDTPSACGARLYQLTYWTVGPRMEPVKASAGVTLPTDCTGPVPLVAFHHGTWTMTTLSMSDPTRAEPQMLMAQFAAHGYAVVAPDHLGYVKSASFGYHPYMHATNSGNVSMDAVRAVRSCLPGTALNGQLFLTGTSEGGFITMATQREMERQAPAEFDITATVATTGPYALADATMSMLKDQAHLGTPAHAWMQLQAYQNAYGDVYTVPTDVFQDQYANQAGFTTLLPSDQTLSQLVRQGRLPAKLEGPDALLKTTFVKRYISNANEPARVHAKENDLRSFTPRTVMNLCYGSDSERDYYAGFNVSRAIDYFGSGAIANDIEQMPQYRSFIDKSEAQGAQYHGNIEAPACTAFARRSVFDPLRK